jgi:DNA repair photolyase
MTELVNINLNESIAIKGCRYLYTPSGAANEYASLAANPTNGCGHHCLYCYMTTRKNRAQKAEFHAGAVQKKDFLAHLTADAKKYQAAGITDQVLFCFSTDAYNPFDTSLTRPSLEIVQRHGMAICVLTKGGSRALADIDLYQPDRDCFASTLTSLDESFSKKWELNAASPADRIATLKKFHDKGIFTWVSLEPTLSPEASMKIVEETHGYVDLYKIGKANYLGEYAKAIDWQDYTMKMITKCVKLGAKHYIKENLQKYLPDGYYNPLRVKQHF